MDEHIKREAAIAIIEEKQKELCPVGRYGRGYVYGSDREKYDAWDEIIDALGNIPSADVVPVVHGLWEKGPSSYWRWTSSGAVAVTRTTYRCGLCGRGTAVKSNYCPNCGAKMDGGASIE
jgi:hypothetical protein